MKYTVAAGEPRVSLHAAAPEAAGATPWTGGAIGHLNLDAGLRRGSLVRGGTDACAWADAAGDEAATVGAGNDDATLEGAATPKRRTGRHKRLCG